MHADLMRWRAFGMGCSRWENINPMILFISSSKKFILFFLFCFFCASYCFAAKKCPNCGYINCHQERYCHSCYTDISNIKDDSSINTSKKSIDFTSSNLNLQKNVTENNSSFFKIKIFAYGILAVGILLISNRIKHAYTDYMEKKKWDERYNNFKKESAENEKIWEQEFKKEKAAMEFQLKPYSILGITQGSPQNEIKKKYHDLVTKYHPDKFINASNSEKEIAALKIKEINWAYNQIKNIVKTRVN
ncbi:MAG: J domain-containing protein [Candidatus Aureabacteria bacterium]|nr:J domain-containing protein [Candidatus Auribacterota bacterium]